MAAGCRRSHLPGARASDVDSARAVSYVGRFAPSPTGALHQGSLAAALASWLDARAHDGKWLVRMEDIDAQRCRPGADAEILRQLAGCGLFPDGPVWWQSQRAAAYETALESLLACGQAYPCACSRTDIEGALRERGHVIEPFGERVYPGTCRAGLGARKPRAWRLRLPDASKCLVRWVDARLGEQVDQVDRSIGDFVLKRADGLWAYQLAVVVDDAAQGVNHVVRGEDLAASTARQILLQRALRLPTPSYFHVPLVLDGHGRKLSKQDGAQPFEPGYQAVYAAAAHLGLSPEGRTLSELLQSLVAQWGPDGRLPLGASVEEDLLR